MTDSIAARLCATWRAIRNDPQDSRLQAALDAARHRLAKLQSQAGVSASVQAASKCLSAAEAAASARDHFLAWDFMHQYDDVMVETMTEEERVAHWISLREEGKEKLKGTWRGEAVKELIREVDGKKPLPVPIVREVQRHVATAAQNMQYKILLVQRSLPYLSAVLVFTMLAALALASHGMSGPGGLIEQETGRLLILGIAAGGLGGLVSMAFTLVRGDLKAKIPDMRMSRLVTMMRPIFGAVVAIPVAVLVEDDFVSIKGLVKPWSVFAFCFLAGFSERWFLGLMEKFESGKK